MTIRSPLRILTTILIIVTGGAAVASSVGEASTGWARLLFAVVVGIYLVVATLIVERQPWNRVGSIVYLLGILVGYYLIADAYIHAPGSRQGADIAAWSVGLLDGVDFLLLALLFLSFPDGRWPSPRWRALVAFDAVLAVVVTAGTAIRPGPFTYYADLVNPFGRPGSPISAVADVAYMLMLAVVALSALSLAGRWRRGGPVEQAQLKWVALAAVAIAVVMVSYGILFGPGAYNEVADVAVSVALGFFPITIGIAILRYHLFEIDRIVSRTIAYGVITAILIATYSTAILLLTGPLGNLFAGDTVSVALSTLVVAALFQPLRRRVQGVVDRSFDRARFDAERTTVAFSGRLRDEVDITTVTADLDRTVRSALRPTAVGLWLRPGDSQ